MNEPDDELRQLINQVAADAEAAEAAGIEPDLTGVKITRGGGPELEANH